MYWQDMSTNIYVDLKFTFMATNFELLTIGCKTQVRKLSTNDGPYVARQYRLGCVFILNVSCKILRENTYH